ncbi:hypothetical protein HDU80_001977 [Chytriomyces hyalinus]|nr:hypothetical protein HDU80_001977 [Chytriomyces hyalinus]
MVGGCIKVKGDGFICGRPTFAGTAYCMQYASHSKKCGSTRTATTAPCAAYATRDFFPYCCSKHDMTRPVQTSPSVLRLEYLRDNVINMLWQNTGHRDSYSEKPINLGKSEVDHVIELNMYRDVLDELHPSYRKKMITFVRDSLANDISNLALTSHDTNIAKFQAIYDCSEDRKAGYVNAAGLTYYLRSEFDYKKVESRRKCTANITKEIVRSYDDQQELLYSGVKAHDVVIATLHEKLVDFKLF